MSLREYEMAMKAAADPTRVRILKLLEKGEMCGCQIVAVLELSQSTVSKHLFLLKMAGLVKERKESGSTMLSTAPEAVPMQERCSLWSRNGGMAAR